MIFGLVQPNADYIRVRKPIYVPGHSCTKFTEQARWNWKLIPALGLRLTFPPSRTESNIYSAQQELKQLSRKNSMKNVLSIIFIWSYIYVCIFLVSSCIPPSFPF